MLKKCFFFFLGTLGLGVICFGQSIQFNKAFPIAPYSDAWSFSVQNASGGYIVYGITVDSTSHEDPAIAKIDSAGNILWQKSYHRVGYDFIPLSMPNELGIISPLGDEVSVANWVNDTSNSWAYWSMYGFDNNGDTSWIRNYHDSAGILLDQIKTTREKHLLVFGEWYNYISMYTILNTLVLIKTDIVGNKIWTKTYHASASHEQIPSGIDTCKDGGYIICAYDFDTIPDYSKPACSSGQIMVMKTDSAGNTQWIKYIPNPLCDVSGYSIRTLRNGGYVICGWWCDSLSDHNQIGWSDLFMVRVNDTGAIIWSKQYGGSEQDEGSSFLGNVKELTNGDLIACGFCGDTSFAWPSGCILKTDSNGNQIWLRFYSKFPPTNEDLFTDIQLTPDGGFISSGYTYGGPYDFWVVKVDSTGCDTIGCNYKTGTTELRTKNEEVIVFPNPNNGEFSISLSNINEKCIIEIYNLMGARVLKQLLHSAQDDKVIEITNQPSGMYFYRVLKEDGGLVGEGKMVIKK